MPRIELVVQFGTREEEVKAKETLYSIRDHFLILLCLIVADVLLKGIVRIQHLLDPVTAPRVDQILSYFLTFIVLIFALFGGAELALHAFKSMRDTALQLFLKPRTQSSVTDVQNPKP